MPFPSLRANGPLLACFAGLLAVVFALQWAGGAYRAEFLSHDDEAAHFVTGLMVRDYLASGIPAPPLQYAENYYFHYPKVAIGHWPPFFYVVQGVWMLAVPPSRFSVMLLMALITAAVAWLLYYELHGEVPEPVALAAAGVFVALPLVQAHTSAVMAETLVALLVLAATSCFVRYAETGRKRNAIGFGILAALALLTKPVGLVVAAVPPMAVVLSRRLDLVKRGWFWAPAAMVAASCAPWYLIVDRAFHKSWTRWGGIGVFESPWVLEARQWHAAAGKVLIAAAAAGLLAGVLLPLIRRGKVSARWAAAAGVLAGFFVFRTFVGASHELRSVLVALPAFMMLAAKGTAWAAGIVPLRWGGLRVGAAVMAALMVLLAAAERFRLVKREPRGFAAAAQELASRPEFADSVVLVSSLLGGEGAFIAEAALRERRPGRVVLRATKVLASSGWSGHSYELRFQTPDEIAAYLESIPVGVVVWDGAPGYAPMEHHELLIEALRRDPARWQRLGSYPADGPSELPRVEVYRQVGHESRPRNRIRLDLKRRLGKVLER
ncbi:MAG TPA: glycosyltransferase family 39 protein [Bryobacteraceae bacterium]|nr:glycosyltransferase family 39 protein [Bryobacteraceae bacterium]